MQNKTIAYIFDMQLEFDSRTQKEIASLINAGYNVIVFEWDKDSTYKIKRSEVDIRGHKPIVETIGIKVKRTKGFKDNIANLIWYEYQLLKWLVKHKNQYNYIHCVNLDTAFVSCITAHLFKHKIIYDIFDDYADAHNCGGLLYTLIKKIDYYVMNKCNAVIICSEKRKEQLLHPINNLWIIHNSPDIRVEEHFERLAERSNGFKIAYVGNLTTNRMIDDLVEIVAKHPEWELHCGGAGVLEESIRKAAQNNSNIYFYGKMKYEDVIALEMKCDVVPAIYDPSQKNNTFAAPNKFYEAMSLGKPTIMIKNTGMDEVVDRERTGIVISGDKEDLEDALIHICREKEKWRAEKPRLVKLYNDNYSWDIMEKKLLEIYRTI